MDALEILKDTHASASVAWAAVEALLGRGARAWEPETLHLELERRGVPWDDAVSAKVLGAQTILTTRSWSHDHVVFFAFAMACDGHPAGSVAHPTVTQLAWAVTEVEALTEGKIGEDEGFDPDGVDPALALVLHDDGWVLTPSQLQFCQHALSSLDRSEGTLRGKVERVWGKLRYLPDDQLRSLVARAPEDAVGVQVAHLADCELEVRARAHLRAEHRRELLGT
jgi:hypothetical protein